MRREQSRAFAPTAAGPLAFSHDRRRLPFSRSHAVGKMKVLDAIAVAANCFCSPTPAAAMGLATEPVRRNCDNRWPARTYFDDRHNPTGASKWHPVEHRLLSEIQELGWRATRK